jgi:LysR family transcriptional regulator, glycine cleavage system transcriptional activator
MSYRMVALWRAFSLKGARNAIVKAVMKRSLIPLNALRAFEAAGRHLSFTKAADELSVTPAAVGQQIRTLEETLGVILFKRTARALWLTPEAERALPALSDAFTQLEEAVSLIQSDRDSHTLTLSTPPSFASSWLMPRLARFMADRPQMQVRVQASDQLTDFTSENVDLAIRYGPGHYPGLTVEKLMDEEVVVVAAPALAQALKTPHDLVDFALLHDDSAQQDPSSPSWMMWLKAAGVTHPDPERGLHANQSALVLAAAVAGQGVALAKRTLALADLQAGRLVQVFKHENELEGGSRLAGGFAYWLTAPPAQWRQRKVQEFIAWLRSESSWGWEI